MLLKYAQEKFYATLAEIIDTYEKSMIIADYLNIVISSLYMETKFSLTPRANISNRAKGFTSVINNIRKEIMYNIASIDTSNSSKEDIDNAVEKFKKEVLKDLLGAILVVHTLSDFSEYCKNSDDPELKKLNTQYLSIARYLNNNSHSKEKIDISDVFIDDSIDGSNDNSKDSIIPHEIMPLDIENISTLEDYYEQLISLLTLLTNASMFGKPYQSKMEKLQNQDKNDLKKPLKQRIVSEIDYSIPDIIKLIELSGNSLEGYSKKRLKQFNKLQEIIEKYPKIPPEIIDMYKIIIQNAVYNSHKIDSRYKEKKKIRKTIKQSKFKGFSQKPNLQSYNKLKIENEKKYNSFDVQLLTAIEEKNKASATSDFTASLSNNQKKKYLIKLRHLKDNLKQLMNDRLHNYIIKTRLEEIINDVNNNEAYDFDIQVHDPKEVNYTNGYSSYHLILTLEDIAFEFQGRTEFRDNMTKSGNSEHNTNKAGKSYNVKKFFELKNPTGDEKIDKLLLFIYCTFLNSMSNNSIKHRDRDGKNERQIYLAKLAKSQIKIKDYILEKETDEQIPFQEYIEKILISECPPASFDVQPNHCDERNTLIIKKKTKKDALLSRFRNRVGVSALAHMVIEKYVKLCSKEKEETNTTADAEKGTYVTVDTEEGINDKANKEFINASTQLSEIKPSQNSFHPQGEFPSPPDSSPQL